MEQHDVAQHWANRITIEFGEYRDLMVYAEMLRAGQLDTVYRRNKHLLKQSITKVPGKPIKLYFLKEMVIDLERFCES